MRNEGNNLYTSTLSMDSSQSQETTDEYQIWLNKLEGGVLSANILLNVFKSCFYQYISESPNDFPSLK